ncbi:MAG: cadherin-like domain-containing protein [Phycicoccus sp.]|nr:cadherin-like domain-containing protein [Phycicoccus sp.]
MTTTRKAHHAMTRTRPTRRFTAALTAVTLTAAGLFGVAAAWPAAAGWLADGGELLYPDISEAEAVAWNAAVLSKLFVGGDVLCTGHDSGLVSVPRYTYPRTSTNPAAMTIFTIATEPGPILTNILDTPCAQSLGITELDGGVPGLTADGRGFVTTTLTEYGSGTGTTLYGLTPSGGWVEIVVQAYVLPRSAAAAPDAASTPVDEPVSLAVLSNDSLLTSIESVQDLTPTESGTVEVSADAQSVQFTPMTGWTGTARFAYTGRAADGKTASATAVVTVVPDAAVNPVAVDDVATVAAGETVTTVDVLDNDRLPNGVASVAVKVAPAHGTAIVNGDGTVAYTVVDGYTGVDGFVYQVTDNLGLTSSAPVAITVVAPPVVVPEPPTPAPTPTPVAELVPAVTRTTVHVAG